MSGKQDTSTKQLSVARKLNILVLADAYGSVSFAPRIRYFCDYLTRQGHYIEVFTEKNVPLSFPHNYSIHEVSIYKTHSVIEWAWKSLLSLIYDYKERRFYKQVKAQAQHVYYDIVLCTTFSTFPLRTALWIANERHIPLVTDIRDLNEQGLWNQLYAHRQWYLYPFQRLYRVINNRRRDNVLKYADTITTASLWYEEFLTPLNKHITTIYNGYDPKQFYFKPVPTKTFVISYIGRTYNYDTSLIYQVLQGLSDLKIELRFYPSKEYGQLPLDKVGDTIRQSSIMLIFSSPTAKGIFPTKFYEALGCEKPILCIPSDNGQLAQRITDVNAGIATADIDTITFFIREKYVEWERNGYTHQLVDTSLKAIFSRERQSQQLEQVLLEQSKPQPLISVIVPFYNAEVYIDQCIQSILTQSYQNLQVILVNDASTDNSLAVVEHYTTDSRIEVHSHSSNQGLSTARNTGLKYSRGEYISFIDADDYIDTDFYTTLLVAIGSFDLVQMGFRRVTETGSVLFEKTPYWLYRFVTSCTRLYRTDYLQQHQLLFDTTVLYYEDILFSLRLWTLKPRYTLIHYAGYNYRISSTTITSTLHPEAQKHIYEALLNVCWHGSLRMRCIAFYTLLKLKAHYLCKHR